MSQRLALAQADPILDAARATVLDFGVRRATVIEVARRAGLSRMTVYRRYPDGATLIRALMAREFGALVATVDEEVAGLATGFERAVTATVRTVELLQEHPLLRRLLELEPEVLLPYVTDRVGRFQELARESLATVIAEGQDDGSIRAGDPARLAAAVEIAGRGFVYAAGAVSADERAAATAELKALVGGYLRAAA